MDYSDIKYVDWIGQIKKFKKKSLSWDEIKYANKGDEEGLTRYISSKVDDDLWSNVTNAEWFDLVDYVKRIEEQQKVSWIGFPKAEKIYIPSDDEGSCWQKYKNRLKDKGFSYASINGIEESATKVLTNIKEETIVNDPTRGLVIGNVQSGKTANMAAVIAMAADEGYNFFIVLSGIIENLRKQTAERLVNDLRSGNLVFKRLDQLTPNAKIDKLQSLNLDASSRERYIVVCLKIAKRLKELIGWLNTDPDKKKKLKILVIDDEADQASLNTAKIECGKETSINKYIKDLVFCKNTKGEASEPYKAMNYISYTATPYGNILNEATDESLYPKNYIVCLPQSFDYIGPQQIFGDGDQLDGLNIVNKISKDEIKNNNNIIKGLSYQEPEELKNALAWFICTLAISKKNKFGKPISMLIHTSQKITAHEKMAIIVEKIMDGFKSIDGIDFIKDVYEKQINKININSFKEIMINYEKASEIYDYPKFEEIENIIKEIVNLGTKHIKLDDEGNVEFSTSIHLCIDNSNENGVDQDGNMMRIFYPDKDNINHKEILQTTPGFIVVGGSTLSRGLTLEGLTTSYFIRSTTFADTLMQMGRWFGYREGYELLPRIWMSQETIDKFEKLSVLDIDLRNEIMDMDNYGKKPSEYAARIDTFPDYASMIKVTTKNKMQSAIEVALDYSNISGQTTRFYSNDEKVRNNFNAAKEFINSLGKVDIEKMNSLNNPNVNYNRQKMWFNQDYKKIISFLKKLNVPSQKANIEDFDKLEMWLDKEYEDNNLENWNVVLGGKQSGDAKIAFDEFDYYLPERLKSDSDNAPEEQFDIKVITQPEDLMADFDYNKLSSEDLKQLNDCNRYREKREKFGPNNTPLLVLYFIDKDSHKGEKNKEFKVCENLVGYYLYIPYGKDNKDGKNQICVELKFNDDNEVEEDENEM